MVLIHRLRTCGDVQSGGSSLRFNEYCLSCTTKATYILAWTILQNIGDCGKVSFTSASLQVHAPKSLGFMHNKYDYDFLNIFF